MFTNLIESASHVREYKRRSSFFVLTVVIYATVLFAAGIVSVYAYDAQLEEQASSLELLNWVPPVARETQPAVRENHPTTRRAPASNAPVDPNIRIAERTAAIPPTNDPRIVPDHPGVVSSNIPVATGPVRITNRNVNPPLGPEGDSSNCTSCGTPTVVRVETDSKPPEPPTVKPSTKSVTSSVLLSKVISLPAPLYPQMARQIRLQGAVNIQILVNEEGKVVSAQVVTGHPVLSTAAKDAAFRARFTPTVLNGQPVKIQGVITYNFVLQ